MRAREHKAAQGDQPYNDRHEDQTSLLNFLKINIILIYRLVGRRGIARIGLNITISFKLLALLLFPHFLLHLAYLVTHALAGIVHRDDKLEDELIQHVEHKYQKQCL